ncbi:MAG: sel1 repeat family protein, partial [Clostridia bacterium]|nr:sel1 repeat family protein [Clostridia bacterium]
HVGRCLLRGIGTGRDAQNAVAALKRAAHDGNLSALLLLSDCHRTGTGADPSPLLCRSFLEKAANGQVRPPVGEAQKLETVTFYPHPDTLAIAEALFRLGQFHATGMTDQHDFALALAYYGRAMIEGNRDAMDEMARIFAAGKTVEQYYQNPPSGTTLAATDAKRMEAVNRMGDLWFFGNELPKDEVMAVKCFRVAAQGGCVAANYSLGWCEKHGKGTPQDLPSAVKHLKFAADTGHPHACFSLAECYESGEGFASPNRREAIALYKKAAAKGHAGAVKKLRELDK